MGCRALCSRVCSSAQGLRAQGHQSVPLPWETMGSARCPGDTQPQPISCPASVSHIHRPCAASALKSHLKRNQGLIHLCLKMVFSHILLLARPPSWGIAPHPIMGTAAAAGGPTPALQPMELPCSYFIFYLPSFFFSLSFPLFYPFCTTTPWGPSRTSGQATSGSIYWQIIYLWTRREKRPNVQWRCVGRAFGDAAQTRAP